MKKEQSPFGLITSDESLIAMYEMKAKLMISVRDLIFANKWSQAEAAKALGVTQPRISNLIGGKLDRFSLDTLVGMLTKLGVNVELKMVTGQSCQNG